MEQKETLYAIRIDRRGKYEDKSHYLSWVENNGSYGSQKEPMHVYTEDDAKSLIGSLKKNYVYGFTLIDKDGNEGYKWTAFKSAREKRLEKRKARKMFKIKL